VYGDQVTQLLAMHYTVLHSTAQHCAALNCAALHCTALRQVTQLLAVSPVWKDYEQQKHDLFLDTEKPLALTQVTPTKPQTTFYLIPFQSSTVGYLTMAKTALPSVPPPIEDNHDNGDGLLG
jgi:hypothetical protein